MKKTTFLIVGKHAVVEALKNPKRKIEKAQLLINTRPRKALNYLKIIRVFNGKACAAYYCNFGLLSLAHMIL